MNSTLTETYTYRRIAVIFGGASGIGEALAIRFAKQGMRVLVADIKLSPNREIDDPIHKNIEYYELDVRDRQAVLTFLHSLERLDMCVSCAGIMVRGSAPHFTDEEWDQTVAVNIMGTINVNMSAYGMMANQRFGHLVNISSSAALFAPTGMLPYITSKYAVLGLSKALRAEAVNHNVKLTVVCPGNIDTPMIATYKHDLSNFTPVISVDKAVDNIMQAIKNESSVAAFPGYVNILDWGERLFPKGMDNLREWWASGRDIQLVPNGIIKRTAATDLFLIYIPEMMIPRPVGEKYLLPVTKWLKPRTRLRAVLSKLNIENGWTQAYDAHLAHARELDEIERAKASALNLGNGKRQAAEHA